MKTQRVGLLVPESNSVMEIDYRRRLPSHVSLHIESMRMVDVSPEGEAQMLDVYAIPAALALAAAKPDVIVFGCTSVGALRGNAYDAAFCNRIENESGVHVVSVIASVREALQRHGVRRIGVLTPYIDSLNERIKASLEADSGLKVVEMAGLGITDNSAIAAITQAEILEFATNSLASNSVELVFISCTNLDALDTMDAISDRLGVPVVTSNQAALEETIRYLEALTPGSDKKTPTGSVVQP